MKPFLNLVFYAILFFILTLLTQVGGIVLILSILIYKFSLKKGVILLPKRIFFLKISIFLILYLLTTCLFVPPIAALFGRVSMPVFSNKYIKPTNFLTCLFNRHYVKVELKDAVQSVANQLATQENNVQIRYLDASFPFINGFPLFPHLSHNDGRKLDISFFYLNKKNGQTTNEKPSFTGYGVFEMPQKGEKNQAESCKAKGFWQYDFTQYMAWGFHQNDYIFDEKRTKALILLFSQEESIQKMFIEPHLAARMGVGEKEKIRFHGCQAVRHDDHLHLQINPKK